MSASVTVTGNVKTLAGANPAGGVIVRATLKNYGQNQPRTADGELVGTAANPGHEIAFDLTPSAGAFTGSLYANSQITPAGTFYRFSVIVNGNEQPYGDYILSGASFDLNSASPITTNPVVAAPTGDTAYLRLDGGNNPTGNIVPSGNGTQTLGADVAKWNAKLAIVEAVSLSVAEQAAPSGVAGKTELWAEVSVHRLKVKDNNGAAAQLVKDGVDINASDQVTATHLASPLPTAQGGTAQNSTAVYPTSGTVVTRDATESLSNKTLPSPVVTGTAITNRLRASGGNAVVAGDFALGAGWGSTASLSVAAGSTDAAGQATITANGSGITANPSVAFTFHDGAFPSAPFVIFARGDGNSPQTALFTAAKGATTSAGTFFAGTPTSGVQYVMVWHIL